MDHQPRLVRIGNQASVFQRIYVLEACTGQVWHYRVRQHLGLPGANAIGIGLDLGQAGCGQHGAKGAGVTCQCPAVGAAADEGPFIIGDVDHGAVLEVDVVAIHQLHTLGLHAGLAQIFEAFRVKALDIDGCTLAVELVLLKQSHHRVFQRVRTRQSAAIGNGLLVVPVRVFGLCVNGNRALEFFALGGGDIQHILRADQGQLAIQVRGPVFGVVQNLAGQQGLELVQ